MQFKELQKLVYEEYRNNAFEELFNKHGQIGDIAELGFIITEVSEAIELIGKKYLLTDLTKEMLSFEIADIIIRAMNFCNRKNINLEEYIIRKNNKNKHRKRLHGRNIL